MADKIKRRAFLTGTAAAGAAAASFTFAAPAAISKERYQWKMVMTWQKALPGLGKGAVRLANRITKLSEGRLTVKPYGGGELVPAMGVFDAVSQGTAEMGHCAPYYWLNKSRAAAFFCSVPGGLTAQEMCGWVYFGGGQKLWDELYAPFGLKSFPAGSTGTQMGGWYNREINTVEDLKGLKIRMPGLAGEVVSRLGASSQTIPPQELFTSMQSGYIDALEWVGPWNDMSLGFHKVSKYYYGPAFHEGGPLLELMVNKKAYDALPKELQQIVKIACATETQLMTSEYHANNIRSFEVLKKEGTSDIRIFPEEVLKTLFAESDAVVADVANDDVMSKKIFESYSQYREQSRQMAPFAELGFMQARQMKQPAGK
jgi:TRAP-type mannitol/chloroaromatic compound transport system substrate-binding protein